MGRIRLSTVAAFVLQPTGGLAGAKALQGTVSASLPANWGQVLVENCSHLTLDIPYGSPCETSQNCHRLKFAGASLSLPYLTGARFISEFGN